MAERASPLLPPRPPPPAARSGLVEAAKRLVPILEWLPAYQWRESSASDLAGAATLGCILVAQSLAHADLCKVALINGPYSCMLPPIVYSVFGTCIHSSVGTGGLISLLTGEQLAAYGDLEERTRAGALFTLLVGAIIALMGLLRLSFLVRFLSRPALSGFITASAILIMASQLKPMLGLPKGDVGGLPDMLLRRPALLEDVHPPTLALSAFSLLFLCNAKRLKGCGGPLRHLASFKELLLLATSAALCSQEGSRLGIEVVGKVPSGLPDATWPLRTRRDLALAHEMLPGAFLVALVTFLSSFAGAKKFATQAGYQVVATNELLALGMANVAGALCGAVPTQIGLSRMGIAYAAGVQSQLGANVYVALVVAAVVQLFSRYLYYVPHCVLNAIIAIGASHLMEWSQAKWLWSLCRKERSHSRAYWMDLAVWCVACLCTLVLGAFAGILVAVAVSLTLIVYQVADPPIIALGYVQQRGRWMNLEAHDEAREKRGVAAFRIEGPLFYANIEALQEWVAELEVASNASGRPLKAIVLSCAAMPFVDTTAVQALRQVVAGCHQRNVAFLIANANGQPARIFRKVLGDLLPESAFDLSSTVQECVSYLDTNGCLGGPETPSPSLAKMASLHEVLQGEPIPLVRMQQVYSEMSLANIDGEVRVRARSQGSLRDLSAAARVPLD